MSVFFIVVVLCVVMDSREESVQNSEYRQPNTTSQLIVPNSDFSSLLDQEIRVWLYMTPRLKSRACMVRRYPTSQSMVISHAWQNDLPSLLSGRTVLARFIVEVPGDGWMHGYMNRCNDSSLVLVVSG
ncbi:hypothetical protein BDV97DRAFT_194214 [Delphinella strobiligena]|nr:hypothetical protein BDV97DRAFT_194214 [Delphinella strobiligena]